MSNQAMIHILVELQVVNFHALELFEKKAAQIIKYYDGEILSAFEIRHNEDHSGEEIHILSFPSKSVFQKYRNDPGHLEIASLRKAAIASTEVRISSKIKDYFPEGEIS